MEKSEALEHAFDEISEASDQISAALGVADEHALIARINIPDDPHAAPRMVPTALRVVEAMGEHIDQQLTSLYYRGVARIRSELEIPLSVDFILYEDALGRLPPRVRNVRKNYTTKPTKKPEAIPKSEVLSAEIEDFLDVIRLDHDHLFDAGKLVSAADSVESMAVALQVLEAVSRQIRRDLNTQAATLKLLRRELGLPTEKQLRSWADGLLHTRAKK